jgi:hypothetical protein
LISAIKKLFGGGKKKDKGSATAVFRWYPEPNFEFSGKTRDI